MQEICLKTPSMQGQIVIGEGGIEKYLPSLVNKGKSFVLTDSNVYALYGDFFEKYFSGAEVFVLPAGEENKNFFYLYEILAKMVEAGLLRTSTLFAVGGGVVGDVGGLCAALFMRGITCIQIPTTLLSQVDSSVGGKTAVDVCRVKNVVGAFYQPQKVLIEPSFLKTLPPREIKCGVGEIVKYAALSKEIFALLENSADKLDNLEFLTTLIAACVKHKAGVVERDEKESGERRSLNVGHTTGHAIELVYNLSHGESVLYGMALETQMAIACGVCEKEYGERLLKIIKKALALSPCEKIDVKDATKYAPKAKADKKNTDDGKIKMAVAKSLGEWTMLALSYEEYVKGLCKAADGLF